MSHAVVDAPLPEEEMLQIERIIKKYAFFFFYWLKSHRFIREDGVVLTQVPQQLFGPLRKLVYRMSPLKNVFGMDGVDKFEDNEESFVQPR